MVVAISGAVIMGVKAGTVSYYRKCDHCQTSEYHRTPYSEAEWIDAGILSLGDYDCPSCGGTSAVRLRFLAVNN